MDLDQLHTFLEIVRLKSFSKAAVTCFRTQPAISAQIRQLEQEMNASLFERLGTRIQITPAGRIFASYAEQILDLRRQAQDSINELERVPRGELVIAANEATCIYVLPLVFSEYKKRFPQVQLLVDRSYGAHVVEAVMDNLADFGNFVAAVAGRYCGKVRYYQIWNEPNIYPEWGNRDADPAGPDVHLDRGRGAADDASGDLAAALQEDLVGRCRAGQEHGGEKENQRPHRASSYPSAVPYRSSSDSRGSPEASRWARVLANGTYPPWNPHNPPLKKPEAWTFQPR